MKNIAIKIIKLPYLLAWCLLFVFIVTYNFKKCKEILYKFLHYKGDVDLEIKMKEDIKEVVWDYIVVMQKIEPHIIGIFWLIILLLIFK